MTLNTHKTSSNRKIQVQPNRHLNARHRLLENPLICYKKKNLRQAGAALKYQALAISHSNDLDADLMAFQILDELKQRNPYIWNALQNKDEIFYLHGYFAGRLSEKEKKKRI